MPPLARVGDISTHGGTLLGPGNSTVMVEGMPAAVAGDIHLCSLPPTGHEPTASAFPSGSATVMVGGRPALRVSDTCACGAQSAAGALTVQSA